ncbi:retrovirus-related pol polyprotein from transposon TNT 1-94 [Tanacetum coccineum]
MDDLIRDRNATLAAFQQEIDTLKETLSNNVKEKEFLSKMFTVFKTESKEKDSKYIDKEIILQKQNKELENIIYMMYRSTVIAKEHAVTSVNDDEETLILEEESRSKMLDKQNDSISIEKKIKISPIDYSKLNKIKEDFDEITEFQTVFKQMKAAVDQLHIVASFVDICDVKKSCVIDCNKCLELETELLKKDSVEKEAHDKLVKSYSKLEKHYISLELATQLNQEISQMENSGENLNAPTFNQLFEINKLKARSQGKDTVIRKLKEVIKSLSGKDSLGNVKKDIDEIETINIELEHNLNAQLQEKVFAIIALKNKLRKLKGKNVFNIAVSKPNATVAPGMFKLDLEALSHETDSLKAKESNKPLLTSTGVKPTTSASGSKPPGNIKNNRITRPLHSNQKNKVEDHSRNVKSSLNKKNSISEPISNALVKHSMRNAKFKSMCATRRPLVSGLRMFKTYDKESLSAHELSKDGLARGIPKLKFQKDHMCSACALGKRKKSSQQPKAEDTNQEKLYLLHMDLCGPMRVESFNGKKYILVIVDDYTRFTWVKFLRSKDEAPDAIIKCIKNIQVHLNATVRNVRTDNGTKFVNQTLRDFYENVGILHQTLVACTPQQNGAAEAINTACYTQNHSLIRLRYNKTPYELMHDKKPDLSFFHGFGSLCYPTNNSEDLGKLNAKVDIDIFVGYAPAKKALTRKIIETIHVTFDGLIAMASKQFGSGPELQVLTPATSCSRLVPNIIPEQPCNPQKRDDWDTLFQPLFDEYFNPPTISISTVQVAAAPRAIEIADSLVSTSIDQDAPSSSIPLTQDQEHSLIISQRVEESPKTPLFHDDPLYEPLHEDSTSQGSSSNVRPSHTPFELIGRWTKDHPIANVIGDPSHSVSTIKQLKTDAILCYFNAFLTSVEPKNFK